MAMPIIMKGVQQLRLQVRITPQTAFYAMVTPFVARLDVRVVARKNLKNRPNGVLNS